MEEKKKASKSKIAANRRYDDKTYSRITWRVPKGYNIELAEKIKPESLNNYITQAVNEKLNRQIAVPAVPDLEAYARSAKLTMEEYVLQAIIEKMQKQDIEFEE